MRLYCTAIFNGCKNGYFQMKIFDIFIIFQSSRKRLIRRIFTHVFGFVRLKFLTGDSHLRQFFSSDATKNIP